jgi:dissimilatory sulfite reductase (desulfoviridin) alpha/beta subunit
MKWSDEAEAAVKRVPFFVRKQVRERIEQAVREEGRGAVSLADVTRAKARFLSGQAHAIQGYRIETCFGPSGCPHRAAASEALVERIEARLQAAELLAFLKANVAGPLKFHHEFRVAVAECPNACSQPQIRDIGIIGACLPAMAEAACTGCAACVAACAEEAVRLEDGAERPRIDAGRCLACGECARACPTGTIAPGARGFRLQLGGRLGRRPRLALELPGLYAADGVVAVVEAVLDIYKTRSRGGERFARLFGAADLEALARRFPPDFKPAAL